MKTQSAHVHAIGAGLLVFLWYFFWFWGIPFDFTADLLYIYDTTQSARIPDLARGIFNPLTPAWFFSDDMLQLRPGQFLLLTLMQAAGRLDLPTAHVIAFSGFALLTGVLFLTLHSISGKKWFAWLGVLLYATFPTHVYSMISIIPVDFQFFELLLMFCAIPVFWRRVMHARAISRDFWISLFVVIATTWLAIKLKSAAKVLPCLFFALWCARLFLHPRLPWRRAWASLVAILAMFVLVIPLFHHMQSSAKEKKSLQLNPQYLQQRVLQSRPESPFPLATLRRVPPGSIAESYGFFLGWIFCAALVAALYRRARAIKATGQEDASQDLFWPALLWFGLALLGFALGEPPLDSNNRYLNYGLLPSVLLLAASLFPEYPCARETGAKRQALYTGILALCFAITIGGNISLFKQWARQHVGFQWALAQAECDIFEDQHRRMPANHEELYRFHRDSADRLLFRAWENQSLASRSEPPLYYLGRDEALAPKDMEFLRRQDLTTTLWKRIALADAPTWGMRAIKMARHWMGQKTDGNAIVIFKLQRV